MTAHPSHHSRRFAPSGSPAEVGPLSSQRQLAEGAQDAHGDSACWAHRVCPECGRLNEDERPETCEACGARFAVPGFG
jgi:rubrerythrin